jgi:O-antigen ligase
MESCIVNYLKEQAQLSFIMSLLITLFLIDLFLGGGGRLFVIAGVPTRMVFYTIILLCYLVSLILGRAKLILDFDSVLVFSLLFWFFISGSIGVIKNHNLDIIIEDLKPLSFFAIYFPLSYYIIIKKYPVKRIFNILKLSGIIISLVTLLILLIGKLFDFIAVYQVINSLSGEFDEFMFRPNGAAFYKGHLYVMVTFFIYLTEYLSKKKSLVNIIPIVICGLSLFLSGTRGLIIGTVMGLVYILFIYFRNLSTKTIVSGITVIIIGVFLSFILTDYSDVNRISSDAWNEDVGVETRINFINEGTDIIIGSPITLIFGNGHGTELKDRPQHLEVSFFDILLEQGLIGFTLWLILLLRIAFLIIRITQYHKRDPLAHALGASVIVLVIFTNTNPFINNPIGIGFIIVTIIALKNNYLNTIGVDG